MQRVKITIRGRIDPGWSEWFGDLTITHAPGNETVLSGQVVDQATLYGLLARLRDLRLELVSVNCEEQG